MIISEVTPGYLRILPSVGRTEFDPKGPTTNFRTLYVLASPPEPWGPAACVGPCLSYWLPLWACMYVLI